MAVRKVKIHLRDSAFYTTILEPMQKRVQRKQIAGGPESIVLAEEIENNTGPNLQQQQLLKQEPIIMDISDN